jgi:polar amino acid transport system substrate-binding protein
MFTDLNLMLKMTVLLMTASSFLPVSATDISAKPGSELTFCYEDKSLPPYYLGNDQQIPKHNPGASIEHLHRLAAAVPNLTLRLTRLPWKRCLAALKTGQVDAVIASYQPEREALGQYPMLGKAPDPKRGFGEHQTCLVSRKDADWQWDGERFSGVDELIIARPLGYAPLKSKVQQKMTMHYTLSGTMDLDLLEKGRIHAVTTLCQIAGHSTAAAKEMTARGLKVLQPPLYRSTGYLVFSHQFYQQHPDFAAALWQQLAKDKAADIYLRYGAE